MKFRKYKKAVSDIIENVSWRVTCMLLAIILICVAVGLFLWLFLLLSGNDSIFETDSISDYGEIRGNYDNNTPSEFIFSFFPDEIEESFSDISYHYSAKKGDTYAYECFLEFVIEDTDTFCAFLDTYVDVNETVIFTHDDTYMDYTISNILDVAWSRYSEEKGYPILYAEIGKILFSMEEQRLVFVAVGVYDGGGAGTSDLNYFFNRFSIDAFDYQLTAYESFLDQKDEITYADRYGSEWPDEMLDAAA